MSHFLISAAHKSSGKTTISIGLCAALRLQGYRVTPFKKGPDYIDPMWLAKAAGKACHNLDFHTMDQDEIITTVHQQSKGSDYSLIEGNKGLYDGLDLHGSNSNAALANLLDAPIILIIDAQGMTRGIAPLILGYQAFDSKIDIAGVVLNKLGGARHESKLRAVIEHYTDVPVIGAVHRDKNLQLVERHLGLIPSNESSDATSRIKQIADIITQQIDLEAVKSIADKSQLPNIATRSATKERSNIKDSDATPATDIRIGIAQDTAFGFYYPGDLDAFAKCGAELVPFNTLKDKKMPACDGLFIGGGFPEIKMIQLEANISLREDIKTTIEKGLPVYAECGGLMYLTRSISWQGKRCDMVGAIPADTIMHEKPQGRGYVQLQETSDNPWLIKNSKLEEIAAHEFHYSSLENYNEEFKYAYKMLRGTGIDGTQDGIIYKNVLGCYSHLRHVKANPWVSRFVDYVRSIKKKTK